LIYLLKCKILRYRTVLVTGTGTGYQMLTGNQVKEIGAASGNFFNSTGAVTV
jgi:hypothetical protein